MVNFETFRNFALALPEVKEAPHHQKTAFKVKGKIFATFNHQANRCCLKFNLVDQDVFSRLFPDVVYAVPNKFGGHGWTLVQYTRIQADILKDLLHVAYCYVAPPKLSALVIVDNLDD
jgi:hypothetical protein